jgi:Mlc titration factor MtfA (ptsG expression regulator)
MYLTDYLKISNKRFDNQRKEFTMAESVQVFIKDKLTNGVNIKSVLDVINSYLPSHLLREVDSIYVGIFDDFEKKETSAAFKDGAIYVSSQQDDEQDLVDDLVHEIAHSLESPYGYMIYGDNKLKDEFMAKREKLYNILKSEGLNPPPSLARQYEYSAELDNYLYKEVGYDKLNFLCAAYGLYTSAYSATSLREYFANGFEYYFLDNPQDLVEICPQLYKKIEELHYYED